MNYTNEFMLYHDIILLNSLDTVMKTVLNEYNLISKYTVQVWQSRVHMEILTSDVFIHRLSCQYCSVQFFSENVTLPLVLSV